MDSEWDHLQEDAIPLPESNSKAMEALMENLEMGSNRARTRTSLERGWDKTIEKLADFRGKMTVAEVVRQMANKWVALDLYAADLC